jgi:hypothetical protein
MLGSYSLKTVCRTITYFLFDLLFVKYQILHYMVVTCMLCEVHRMNKYGVEKFGINDFMTPRIAVSRFFPLSGVLKQ